MSNWGFVALAYALTWAALAGFAIYLGWRRRRALERLAETEAEIGGVGR